MRKGITLGLKALLLVFVATYVVVPDAIDSKYGHLVAIATVILIAWMAVDGISAAKKLARRDDFK